METGGSSKRLSADGGSGSSSDWLTSTSSSSASADDEIDSLFGSTSSTSGPSLFASSSATGGSSGPSLFSSVSSDVGSLFDSVYLSRTVESGRVTTRDSVSMYNWSRPERSLTGSEVTKEQFQTLQDSVSLAHRRLKNTNDELLTVHERITLICADGNHLSERVSVATNEIVDVQRQLMKMNKEIAHMQDHFSAEINFVNDQHEEKFQAANDRIARLEATVFKYYDL